MWALQLQPTNSKIPYKNNVVFSTKNMVYSTWDHKRKHYHTFFQNQNKKMETRLPMPALQEIFAICWFCLKINFISLVNPPNEEAYSNPSMTARTELSVYIGNGVSPWITLVRSLACLNGFCEYLSDVYMYISIKFNCSCFFDLVLFCA